MVSDSPTTLPEATISPAAKHDRTSLNARSKFWLLAACVLVTVTAVALLWVDQDLKVSPTLGYRPANAHWTFATSDFGKTWKGFEETSFLRTLRAETPLPIDDLILSVRQATGIRLTPTRWRTYLGRRFVASSSPDGSGWCVRPGLLLRGLSLLHSAFIATPLDDGIYSFGHLEYANHKGFLLVSSSRNYLRAARNADVLPISEEIPDTDFSLHRASPSEWSITVSAEEGLPINGTAEIDITPRTSPLTLTQAWPEDPLIAITGSNPRPIVNEIINQLDALSGSERFTDSLGEMGFMLPHYTRQHEPEFSLAVLDLDTSNTLAVPELALVLRGVKPRFSLMPPPQSIPFEWNGQPGWIRPWLGEKMSVCWAADNRFLYYANQQSVMARTVGRLEAPTSSAAHVELVVNWAKLSSAAVDHIRLAARHELLPRLNASDAETLIIPYLQSLEHFGALHIQGRADGRIVHFAGHLATTNKGQLESESETAS